MTRECSSWSRICSLMNRSIPMSTKYFNFYTRHEEKSFPAQKQLIKYSFNEKEQTIIGHMEEKEGQIYLFEYRGIYVGTEFFISFSKQSISYKLIEVNEMAG